MNSPPVLVAHSGRQHSHHLALALEKAGLLGAYWAGVPTRRLGTPWMPRAIWDRLVPYASVPLPHSKVRHLPIVPVVSHTLGRALSPARAAVAQRAGEKGFDRWVATRLKGQPGVRAVVAYENAALHTFSEARRRGIVTILDAASIHHTEQDRVYGYTESAALHRQITRDKDAEIA